MWNQKVVPLHEAALLSNLQPLIFNLYLALAINIERFAP